LAGPKIHAEAEVGMKLGMKSSGVIFADLIAQSGKVNDPVEFVAGGTWHLITFRHILNEAGNRYFGQRKT
jgi:hypothetical protein